MARRLDNPSGVGKIQARRPQPLLSRYPRPLLCAHRPLHVWPRTKHHRRQRSCLPSVRYPTNRCSLGPLWHLWSPSGASLEPLWAPLWKPLWGSLEPLWGSLGPFWSLSGALWNVPCAQVRKEYHRRQRSCVPCVQVPTSAPLGASGVTFRACRYARERPWSQRRCIPCVQVRTGTALEPAEVRSVRAGTHGNCLGASGGAFRACRYACGELLCLRFILPGATA